jgi:hypothetical protein
VIVKLLRITVYDETGWNASTEDVQDPTWEAIEAAVWRLDRFRYPFIHLFGKRDTTQDDVPDFTVIGGERTYAMDCLVDDAEYRFCDPTRGDKEVVVWRSDQGATFAEKYCCTSITRVLQATRYFCEHGAPDLSLTWELHPL